MTAIIGWAPVHAPWPDGTLAAIEPLVPASQFTAIMQYHRWQDRQARLLARLILRRILSRQGGAVSLDDVALTGRGRPFVPCGGDFSITHTTTLAACAWVPHGRVGIDVERRRHELMLEDMLPWMSDAERRKIATSRTPLDEALLLWTAKEAVCKADGCGIASGAIPDCAAPLVAFRDKVWQVRSQRRRGHAMSIARVSGEPSALSVFRLRVEDEVIVASPTFSYGNHSVPK